MKRDQIIEFIESQILQAKEGYSVETNKLDFKREWYKFDKEDGKSEFLKDASAIVNSYGGDSGFLVIGVSEKGETSNCPFKESGFSDSTELLGIIKRNVDRPFNIEVIEHTTKSKNTITIIHLLPSLEKPHLLRCYKKRNIEFINEIFVRKSSGTERASKGDIDLMYAEKGTILIERNLTANVNINTLAAIITDGNIIFNLQLMLDNSGIRNLYSLRFDLNMTVKSKFIRIENRSFTLKIFAEVTIPTDKIYKETFQFPFAVEMKLNEKAEFVNYFNEYKYDDQVIILNYLNILLSDGTTLTCPIKTIFTGKKSHIPKIHFDD